MKSKKKINKQTEQVIYCPYCGAKARLIKARELYGEKAHQPEEYIYVCSNYTNGCNAYVTTHRGTKKPKGFMADGKLRNLRIQAHQWIKKVIEIGTFSENDIYEYLNVKIPYTKGNFHVGTCNEFQCQAAIAALQEIISLNQGKRIG